jgi:hypothetical protein
MDKKLGIVVPYRDRYEDLVLFKKEIAEYLKNKGIIYELIIVEQDKAKTFNRGKLLNIGFMYAKRMKCDYVIFHDIDMIPLDCDYGYEDYPVHLSSNFVSTHPTFKRTVFDEYFGGVTLFPVNLFEDINGYSNEYWGWGYEDDDLLFRCRKNRIPLKIKEFKTSGASTTALKFNGKNTYVKAKNVIDTNHNFSIFISFCPDDIHCDFEKYDDVYTVFSIDAADAQMQLTYSSYKKYTFELRDELGNVIYINSDIKPNYQTTIIATINPVEKKVRMFQDGELVGETTYENNLYDYSTQRNFYLGCKSFRKGDDSGFFMGTINSFAVYNEILTDEEIKILSDNKYFGLTQNFEGYNSSDKLTLYYDAKIIKDYKLVDLSFNENPGAIFNCSVVPAPFEDSKMIEIPHRKENTFKLIPHDENGFVINSWKNITTRYNQIRFFNEVSHGFKDSREDGLSNLTFKELNRAKIENQTHIVVSI